MDSRETRRAVQRLAAHAMVIGSLAGCDTRSKDALVAQAGDCYDVTPGAWTLVSPAHEGTRPTIRPDLAADSLDFVLPVRVRLDAKPVRSEGFRRMAIPDDALQTPHRLRAWRNAADTLGLILSTGYAGTHIRLTPEGDSWVGSGTTWDDYSSMQFRREVRLEAVDCSTPPSLPATADRPLVRSIRLEDGAVVTLGQRLPPGTPTAVARSGLWVQKDAARPWAGTESILVVIDREDSVVTLVAVRYPGKRNLDVIHDSLESVSGPGVQAMRESRSWLNRTTRLYLHQDNEGWRLVFEDPRWH